MRVVTVDGDADVLEFAIIDEVGSGGATANGAADIGDDYFNPLRNLDMRFEAGDPVYVKKGSAFRNRRTTVRAVKFIIVRVGTLGQVVVRAIYITDLGEFDDDDLLTPAEQQTALEAEKASLLNQIRQRRNQLLGV